MAKENTIPTRIPAKIYKDLDRALEDRFRNGLISRKDLKIVEGFRLLGRTQGYQQSLNELRLKPKKEDIKL